MNIAIFRHCDFLPDIIAFSETRLNSKSKPLELTGYSCENVNSPTCAGGVALLISNKIDYIVRDDLCLNVDDCEDLWIEIQVKKSENNRQHKGENIVIGLIYRHPRIQYLKFAEAIEKNLVTLGKKYKKTLILGDFNIDLMKFNVAGKITEYINLITSYGFNLGIDKPTRVTARSATCIDHVYSNMPSEDIESLILESSVSDHYSTLTKIRGVYTKNEELDIYYRNKNLSAEQWECFNSELQYNLACNLPYDVDDISDIDVSNYANLMTEIYKSLIEKYMPLKKKSRKQKKHAKKPWITQGLIASIDKKDELYKLSKKDPSIVQKHKAHSNLLGKLKNKAMLEYDRQKFIDCGNDKSKTWKHVNEIMKRKKKKTTSIKLIRNKEGKDLRDLKQITNCLNVHFATIGKDMAQNHSNHEAIKNPLDYISKRVERNMSFSDTDCREILDIVLSQDDKKACGYDEINNKIIKKTANIAAPFIKLLFNASMKQGEFPDCFKLAQVTPLFKGGEKSDLGCYRPISLLPAMSKILEKIIQVRVMNFLTEEKVISEQQFGFRPKFSTEYAILDIYEKLTHNLDNSLSSCAIFLDLAKAFDTVSHDILLQKLEVYGIRGNCLKLFESYLKNRYQFVKLDNEKSEVCLVEFGVPQGSVLGPLLFLLYINDLSSATNLFVKLFADDTFLCAQNKDAKLLEEEVNFELDKVYNWMSSNRLTLNISKSKYMIISRKRKIEPMTIKIKQTELEHCDSYKYLGVLFDKDLSWKPHIEYICGKISKSVGGLAMLRHRTSISVLREVYHALISSYIKYGILAWGNASDVALQPLKLLLNKVVRIITFAPYGPLDLEPIYNELEFLNLHQTFSYERGKFMFKRKKDLLPITIANYFETDQQSQHSYSLRNRRNDYNHFRSNTTFGEKSIQNRGETLWRDLPQYLKDLDSIATFKKYYKSYLLALD